MGVGICEVGPRDGLQNEDRALPVGGRIELIDRLATAGIQLMEAASFVSPTRVPQMAGAEVVLAGIRRRPGTRYAGLILNERGAQRAIEARVDLLRAVIPATDTFSHKNQGTDVRGAVAEFAKASNLANRSGIPCAAVIAVAFGCPFEGAVAGGTVVALADELTALGASDVVLADTIGVAIPDQVTELFDAVAKRIGPVPVGGHFHNTRNTGLANALAAADSGARVLDAAIGGTGGCPFAPRASGNVPTEDLVYMLGQRLDGAIDADGLIETAIWLESLLGRPLPGMLMKAGARPLGD